MKQPLSTAQASAKIDQRIEQLGDWRGKLLAKIRKLIHQADPDIVEEWKWMGTPIFSHDGIICTGETYKRVVKLTFAKGAFLADPSRLFNSSLEGNMRRAIDIHEGEKVNEAALKALIRAALALNQSKAKANAGAKAARGPKAVAKSKTKARVSAQRKSASKAATSQMTKAKTTSKTARANSKRAK